MQSLLQDCIIIVVGAGPALGQATALACTEEGAKVVLAARSEAKMTEVADDIAAKGGTALAVLTDMLNPADRENLVAQAVDKFGRIDGLVCVAYKHHDNTLLTDCPRDIT